MHGVTYTGWAPYSPLYETAAAHRLMLLPSDIADGWPFRLRLPLHPFQRADGRGGKFFFCSPIIAYNRARVKRRANIIHYTTAPQLTH